MFTRANTMIAEAAVRGGAVVCGLFASSQSSQQQSSQSDVARGRAGYHKGYRKG